jgi:hypothetical protein
MLGGMSSQTRRRAITPDDRDTLAIATGLEAVVLFAGLGLLLIWWLA